jgi:S-adenosylmethionine/arginine decarboxylase-like enzyme
MAWGMHSSADAAGCGRGAERRADFVGDLVQIIETSSITGHVCDLTGNDYIDVFSCRAFDPDVAVDLILERLGARSVSRTVTLREAAQPQPPM